MNLQDLLKIALVAAVVYKVADEGYLPLTSNWDDRVNKRGPWAAGK